MELWMKRVQYVLALIFVFLLTGCSQKITDFFGKTEEIPLAKIDENIRKAMPVVRKGSFGSLKIIAASNQPAVDEKRLEVMTKFILTSFEIPEGIDGIITCRAGLRYDPEQKVFYYSDLNASRIVFGNKSLEEYVSPAARQAIPGLVADVLMRIPIYRMDPSFSASRIKKLGIVKEKLLVEFEK
jgi:hypothetical protein